MDHDTAVRTHSPERYILGDLAPGERDEFEYHLSDCPLCMEDLSAADAFAVNAKAVFKDAEAHASPTPARWFDFLRLRSLPALAFSGALNLALLGFIGYGLLRLAPSFEKRIASLEAPGVAETYRVRGVTRGASQMLTATKSSAYVTLRLDLPKQYEKYEYAMNGPAGFKKAGSLPVPADAQELNLTIPVAGRDPGEYTIRFFGSQDGQREEIGSCVLRVEP